MANPLNQTKAAILKIWGDFKKVAFYCNVATQCLTVAYLVYALCAPSGLWYVNTVLLALAVSYSAFFLYMTKHETSKEFKKIIKTTYKWAKRAIKLFTLGITVYGLFLAADYLTPLALILPTFTIVSWTLGILVELICAVIESRLDYVFEGLAEDFGKVPFLGKWVKDLTGKDGEEEIPSEKLLYLRNEVAASEAVKEERRAAEKERKKAKKREKWKAFFSKK